MLSLAFSSFFLSSPFPIPCLPVVPEAFLGARTRERQRASGQGLWELGALSLSFLFFRPCRWGSFEREGVKGQLENQPSFPETRPFVVVARGLSTGRDSGRGVCFIPQHILLFLLLTPLSLSAQILDKTS